MQTTIWYNGVKIYKGTRIRGCDIWDLECNLVSGDHFWARKRNVTLLAHTGPRNLPNEMFSPGKYRIRVVLFESSGKIFACGEAQGTLI